MNAMLGMAKKRTKRGRDGGWMRRALPIVYDNARHAYQRECLREAMAQGVKPPREPWEYWHLEYAGFRLHSLRDPVELAAGLKWACDFLVKEGFVADDSPRGLDIVIRRKKHPPKR